MPPNPDQMPDLSSLFPFILATHITLAIALFVPSLLLPFTLRNRLVSPGYDAPAARPVRARPAAGSRRTGPSSSGSGSR